MLLKQLSICICFLILMPLCILAQDYKDTIPSFLKNTTIPHFKILQHVNDADSVWFTNDSLPVNRPIVFIYFSPECGHCQYEAEEMMQHMDSLGNAFFVWMSYGYSLEQLATFYKKYKLNKCSNMRLGKLVQYKIPAFYKIEFTPYMAVYNAQKSFIAEFRRGAKPSDLIALVYR